MGSALRTRPGLGQAEMEWTGLTGDCGHSGGPVILCLSSDCLSRVWRVHPPALHPRQALMPKFCRAAGSEMAGLHGIPMH